jgi:hypothetical protein
MYKIYSTLPSVDNTLLGDSFLLQTAFDRPYVGNLCWPESRRKLYPKHNNSSVIPAKLRAYGSE